MQSWEKANGILFETLLNPFAPHQAASPHHTSSLLPCMDARYNTRQPLLRAKSVFFFNLSYALARFQCSGSPQQAAAAPIRATAPFRAAPSIKAHAASCSPNGRPRPHHASRLPRHHMRRRQRPAHHAKSIPTIRRIRQKTFTRLQVHAKRL
jgi:hypothetical protein